MVPVREFLPMFSVLWCHGVRSFMVSCLIFMSLSPFEFIFVYGARVGSHFICVHATIQLCERYFCHIREIQNGPPLWVGKSPKNSQKHSMTEWDSNTWVCFVTVFFFFWPCREASRIWIPWPGIKPAPPILTAWSCHHWAAREVPMFCYLKGPEHLALPNSDHRSYEASPRFWLGAREEL